MNKSDSERIASVLESAGCKPASKIKEADLIVVNACSVRQTAIDRIHGMTPGFLALKKSRRKAAGMLGPKKLGAAKNKNLRLIITGCILKPDKKKFEEAGFDFILNIKDLPKWTSILDIGKRAKSTADYLQIEPKYKDKKLAYIPVSNGCDNFCTYCVVPYTRGRLICRSYKDILKETKTAIKNGIKEIWLLGQNVNDYMSPADKKINFARLLNLINGIQGNFKIRFTSSNPKNFSDELIATMAKCGKIDHSLNLPVQSGDNKILKAMNRPYTVQQYKILIKKIKKAIPDIKLSTDIIVGFPGETKSQFENTLKLFKEIDFDMAYIARFSPRPETPAAKMKDSVSHKEKERRWNKINNVLLKKWGRKS